jgi:hypothetical protein
MLVDTSVWIDLFAGRETPELHYLEQAIGSGDDIALCGIVLTEILHGNRNDAQYRRIRQHLKPLLLLPMSEPTFVRAAELFPALKNLSGTRRGKTPRGFLCHLTSPLYYLSFCRDDNYPDTWGE